MTEIKDGNDYLALMHELGDTTRLSAEDATRELQGPGIDVDPDYEDAFLEAGFGVAHLSYSDEDGPEWETLVFDSAERAARAEGDQIAFYEERGG
jgi:hypothetical protein